MHDVDHAPNLETALNLIVVKVAQMFDAEVCSVYLNQEDDVSTKQLVLKANVGFPKEAIEQVILNVGDGLVGMVAERSESLKIDDAHQSKHFYQTSSIDEARFKAFLGVPIIEHGLLQGVLVTQKCQGIFSDEEEAILTTLASRLSTALVHAKNTRELNQDIDSEESSINLKGAPGSPGIAQGIALVLFDKRYVSTVKKKPSRGQKLEYDVLSQALKLVISELNEQEQIMRSSLPEAEVALFAVYAQMLQDGPLVDEAYRFIEEGDWAPYAWRTSVESHAAIFDAMEDPYLAERGQDVRDLGERVLKKMMDSKEELIDYPDQTILIGQNITVTNLARAPEGKLKAIVSGHGSKSSHVAILAHALGIPAVMGISNFPSKGIDGKITVVDGYSGRVHINPEPELYESLKSSISDDDQILNELKSLINEPATTLDGINVSVHVNSGLKSDLSESIISGADGIGLYRTEVPFQIRERFPSESEQYDIYRNLLSMFKGKPVVLRTLDVGGDKPLNYFPINEENPFLGWRGIRITLDHPEIFITQVRAMLRANIEFNNLHILLPMITSKQELDDALILIHRAKNELDDELNIEVQFPKVGVMIEVPSAVYQIEELCQLVDFASIGTNDLTQYLLAVDRNNENVADIYNSMHPAVLKALQQIVQGATKQNTPVSVCGEMAGDPLGMIMLLGLGIKNLSMSVGSIGRVKHIIRHFSMKEAAELLAQAIELSDGDDAQDLLIEVLNEKGLGGLIRAGY